MREGGVPLEAAAHILKIHAVHCRALQPKPVQPRAQPPLFELMDPAAGTPPPTHPPSLEDLEHLDLLDLLDLLHLRDLGDLGQRGQAGQIREARVVRVSRCNFGRKGNFSRIFVRVSR